MKILLVDNYDSFTYNLLHLLEQYPGAMTEVKRNDEVNEEILRRNDAIVFSPGPGLPQESPALMNAVRWSIQNRKVLGVCLGLQAIAMAYGAQLKNLDTVRHGTGLPTKVIDTKDVLYKNMPASFICGRYHSWVIDPKSLAPEITVTAKDEEGNIMGIRHLHKPVWGIQFHPESILTEYGKELIFNWISA